MSICDKCIHDEVCGLEDNHEEAVTFCSDMIPKDVLDKIRAEIKEQYGGCGLINDGLDMALSIIDKYKTESEDKE